MQEVSQMDKYDFYTYILKKIELVFNKCGLRWPDPNSFDSDEHTYYNLQADEALLRAEADRIDYCLRFGEHVDKGGFSE